MLLLELPQLAQQPIVFGIRRGRRVEDEVLVVRAVDFLAQPFGTGGEVVVQFGGQLLDTG